MNWNRLAEKSLAGEALTRDESQSVLAAGTEKTALLVAAAYQVRYRHFRNRVRLNYLLNAKSGICPEDCNYCSQSKLSHAPIDKYPWMSVAEAVAMADRAVDVHAGRFCLVASGRGPSEKELAHVVECVQAVRAKH